MTTFQDILSAARALDVSEQILLASTLLQDAPADAWPLPSQEWIDEAQRRSAEYDAGLSSASSWPEVRERVRRQVHG